MWTKKPASVTSPRAARGRDGRRGWGKGHAPGAVKKATWREKTRGRAAYFAFRSPAVAPGIKACRCPESFQQRKPQTSFSPTSCILQMRKPRPREGQGRPPAKGSICVDPGVLSKRANIHSHVKRPLNRLPPGNEVASFLSAWLADG